MNDHQRRTPGAHWETPRITTEHPCAGSGTCTYDEVYGWLHRPDGPAGCTAPPAVHPQAVIGQ